MNADAMNESDGLVGVAGEAERRTNCNGLSV